MNDFHLYLYLKSISNKIFFSCVNYRFFVRLFECWLKTIIFFSIWKDSSLT